MKNKHASFLRETVAGAFLHVVDGVAAKWLVNEECFICFNHNYPVTAAKKALSPAAVVNLAAATQYNYRVFG